MNDERLSFIEKEKRIIKSWIKYIVYDKLKRHETFEQVLKQAQKKEDICVDNPVTFDDKI